MKLLKGIAIASLGLCSMANAAMYQNACQNQSNVVPCENKAWSISADALYMQNVGNLLDSYAQPGPGMESDFGWGFRIQGSYYFSNGNDITINWSSYDKTSHFTDTLGTVFNAGNQVEQQNKFDVINIEFGQKLDFGERFDIRAHGGIQYGKLMEKYREQLTGTYTDTDKSDIDTIGPRVGINTSFLVKDNISVFANGGIALLSYKETAVGTQTTAQIHRVGSVTRKTILTETDLKLGLQYDRMMTNGMLSTHVAWENMIYNNGAMGVTNLSWGGISLGAKWTSNA